MTSADSSENRQRQNKPNHLSPTTLQPQQEQEHLPCPRCESTNTKFCYYNNYNFSQPRHFCKSCRRYWTQGGTLRDIPIGGGSRKNAKRSRTCSSYTTTAATVATTASNTTTATSAAEVLGAAPVFVYNGMTGGVQFGSDVKGNSVNVYGGVVGNGGASFTSLLSNQGGAGFLALGGGGGGFGLGLGLGHGFEDVGFGKGVWPFTEVGYGGGGAAVGGGGNGVVGNTWQLENGDGGFVGGDCFSWPELAISTPGNAFK